jgi:hypothetical protein
MGKKIALVVGLLVVIGGLVWWFALRTDVAPVSDDESSGSGQSTNIEGAATGSNAVTGNNNPEINKGAAPVNAEGILPMDDAAGTDDIEDSDYSEPVDKEDFADFVNAAIEELESDEVMANAIVTEMVKILEAQPALEDEGIRFYRQCIQKGKVAATVKEKCTAELKKRGLE